ncbi:MAG: cytochrome c biogenesis CcdA family protein [Candidatus Dormibacteraceae bacterium]
MLLPLLALLAGILSFSSPCLLPLIPGYLSYISGVGATRGRSLQASILFVIGFSIVFVTLGAAASSLGRLINGERELMEKVAGVVIVLLGLSLLGLIKFTPLLREARPLLDRVKPGPKGALLLGMAFALGWTPCIGPVLGSIILLASNQPTALAGASLLLLYSLGLGLPFILIALGVERWPHLTSWLRRRGGVINLVTGGMLVVTGALVFLGMLNQLLSPALAMYTQLHWPPI